MPNASSSSEICNGLDDDCDGMTDENNPGGGGSCTTNQPGICAPGTLVCQNGGLACVADNMPIAEICNGVDDDCDGVVDDGNPGGGSACSTGQLGICGPGVQQCVGGMLDCVSISAPTSESCNGLDDDCDGMIDEGNPGGGASCNTGQLGVCGPGTQPCQGGSLQCVPDTAASAEVCSDALDNDCDGQTDAQDDGCCHAVCTTGNAMVPACNACVADICAVDPWCCNNSWDSLCVEEVRTICGSLTCPESAGTCPHSLCSDGGSITIPFSNSCDANEADCVSQICAVDTYCCSTDWDSICVSQVSTVCMLNCTYE